MTFPLTALGPNITGRKGFSARGITPQTAHPLYLEFSAFSTVVPGAYAQLPGADLNELTVYDEDVNDLLVIPEVGDQIGTNGINVAVTVPAGTAVKFSTFDTPLTPKPRTWHVMSASASSGGAVVAGAGISVTSGNTVALGTIAAGDLMGNSNTIGATPSAIAVGANLSLTGGTLSATGTTGVTSLATGAGLTGGPVTGTGTISLANINNGLLGNSGTVSAAPSAVAIGTNLTLTGGTLTATAGTGATVANQGVVLNSGTVQINNAITLAGTAAGTVTIAPTTGTSDVILTMPASGGTVTAVGNASFSRQRMLLEIHQGATAGVLNLGTVFHFTGANTSFTLTPTASVIDRLEFVSTDGTNWVNLAINQNATL